MRTTTFRSPGSRPPRPSIPASLTPVISLANIPLAIARIRLVTRTRRNNYQCRWLSTKERWLDRYRFIIRLCIYTMRKLLEFGQEKIFNCLRKPRIIWHHSSYQFTQVLQHWIRSHEFEWDLENIKTLVLTEKVLIKTLERSVHSDAR